MIFGTDDSCWRVDDNRRVVWKRSRQMRMVDNDRDDQIFTRSYDWRQRYFDLRF